MELKSLLDELVEKEFIEKDDAKNLIKNPNNFNEFKKKYEFNFDDKPLEKIKDKKILVVIGQENCGKTYFIKLLYNQFSKETKKIKKMIDPEELTYERNKIYYKLAHNDKYLIARINLNPIFSANEENYISNYFIESFFLLNNAIKIFYVTNNDDFNLNGNDRNKFINEINNQLIYFDFKYEDNSNKFVIVKNLFYNETNKKIKNKNNMNNNINNNNNIINRFDLSDNEIVLSSHLIENLNNVKLFIENHKKWNDNSNIKNKINSYNNKVEEIKNYYLNRFDFSRQLNDCNVDYNYGIDKNNKLLFYIEVPEENDYKIEAKSIELENYVLIQIIGEIKENNNKIDYNENDDENKNKKFEIYENIDKKELEKENVNIINSVGKETKIEYERAYLVTF